jgi:hypothetical protein
MNKIETKTKTNEWFDELEFLKNNYEKFCADDLKLICYARSKEMPEPAPNLANVLRSSARQGQIEPINEYAKSRWIKSNRIPRQYWRKVRKKKVS